jgi:pimeloyl-ACP methyl ester carboxylesterase
MPRSTLFARLASAALALALGSQLAQAGQSFVFPPDAATVAQDGITLADAAHSVVILYTAGSDSNVVAQCRTGAGVPPVLREIAGTTIAGARIVVHGYCPDAIGDLGRGVSMSEARAPEIERVLKADMAQGVPASRVFVAGHSMGGWAAVLVGLRHEVPVAGVIAFAPANGVNRRPLREQGNWWALRRELDALKQAPRLDALIYTFTGDDASEPDDLQIAARIPGVTYREWSAAPGCERVPPHFTVLAQPCFTSGEKQAIVDFIAARLQAAH